MFKQIHFWGTLSPIIFSLLLTIVILTLLQFLPTRLPLFYSLPWGEKQLATHQQFFILPASIGLITLLNLIISWQLHASQVFFKKVLMIASFTTSLILIITFIKIVINFI